MLKVENDGLREPSKEVDNDVGTEFVGHIVIRPIRKYLKRVGEGDFIIKRIEINGLL